MSIFDWFRRRRHQPAASPTTTDIDAFIERLRERRKRPGRIIHHRLEELEPYDEADHDDDEHTDHLARLADPDVLARVEQIEREQEGKRYGLGRH